MASASLEPHPLDNPIWHTLSTFHAPMSLGAERAKRYPPEISALALIDHSEAAIADLDDLIAPGEFAVWLESAPPATVPGWTIHERHTLTQMVREQPAPDPSLPVEVIPLSAADVPEMEALVDLMKPGPFSARALEMGAFYGIRSADGRLAAMAGQRLHFPGFAEICTVCTHPDFQGRGYAARLVSRMAALIEARGERAFLHVVPENERAVKLYERLGFRKRADMEIMIIGR